MESTFIVAKTKSLIVIAQLICVFVFLAKMQKACFFVTRLVYIREGFCSHCKMH